MVLVVHGFPTKVPPAPLRLLRDPRFQFYFVSIRVTLVCTAFAQVQALQFEWCWQKPRMSSRIREVWVFAFSRALSQNCHFSLPSALFAVAFRQATH